MSKKPIVLIFGVDGRIGVATREIFLRNNYLLIPVNRKIIDLSNPLADRQIHELLMSARPNVVVNCAGVFEDGYSKTHYASMNVNFGSNWSIVRYYANNKDQTAPTNIVLVGGKDRSIENSKCLLYSTSKAAVQNLWQQAADTFAGSNISINLVNPSGTQNTPQQVAEEIFKLTQQSNSSCVDMTL